MVASNYNRIIIDDPVDSQYAAFVGAYVDQNNGDIWLGYHRAVGNTNVAVRGRAPDAVYTAVDSTYTTWYSSYPDGAFDFWAMDNRHEWWQSTDDGATFALVREDDLNYFSGSAGTGLLIPHPLFPQATMRLPNGDLLRRVNGEDMGWWDGTPRSSMLERWPAGGSGWTGGGVGEATSLLGTTTATTIEFCRLRLLENGALIACGQDFNVEAGTRTGFDYTKPLLRASTDNGYTWADALTLPANWTTPDSTVPERLFPNEWDFAECANGDLLAILRTGTIGWSGHGPGWGPYQLAQVRLVKDGTNHWTWTQPITWPLNDEVGGSAAPTQPEMLKVKTGDEEIMMFFTRANSPASAGFYWTGDEGETWNVLDSTPSLNLSTQDPYYPRSVVTYPNDVPTVNVFGHYGYDNYPGQVNNKIVQHRFTLPANTPVVPPDLTSTPGLVRLDGKIINLTRP